MTRKEIMDKCPEEFEDELKDFIDSVESKFVEIEELLSTITIDFLDNIVDARAISDKAATDLY